MMMVDKGGFTGLLMRFCGPVAFFFFSSLITSGAEDIYLLM